MQLLLTYRIPVLERESISIRKVVGFFPQAYSINKRYTRILTQSIFEMGFVLIFITTLLDDVIP